MREELGWDSRVQLVDRTGRGHRAALASPRGDFQLTLEAWEIPLSRAAACFRAGRGVQAWAAPASQLFHPGAQDAGFSPPRAQPRATCPPTPGRKSAPSSSWQLTSLPHLRHNQNPELAETSDIGPPGLSLYSREGMRG